MLDPETLHRLKGLRREFGAVGIEALYLFGSQARGSGRPDSDVDLAFDVRPDARFSLLDQARSQVRLAEVIGQRVDLVERAALHPSIRPNVEREMVRLF